MAGFTLTKSGVNNVELKTLRTLTGVAATRSTPHYWALNINQE
jgi:hypothetical protein